MRSKLKRDNVAGRAEARAYTKESLVKDRVTIIIRLV
jgi:hypothetical protein